MEARIKELKQQCDSLFSKRLPLVSLWQSTADNFYPERADFTTKRGVGTEFASHLTTSFPILARRELGDAFSSMLRPKDSNWFAIEAVNLELSRRGKIWLENSTHIMRSAMYDKNSGFVRSTKEGDHDYAAFGQCVISIEVDRFSNTLLYRNWHLRDVVWTCGADGKVQDVYHKQKLQARELVKMFKGNVSSEVKRIAEKEPLQEICIVRAILDSRYYEHLDVDESGTPYVSVYFEEETGNLLEEIGIYSRIYCIPRWQTVSGSQYAFSPATVAALPDARLLQSMMLTLLEAGEKAVNPALIATHDVIRSDVNMFAGGITYIDREYDERLGDAVRPLNTVGNINIGFELLQGLQSQMKDAFYLNKLNLPAQMSGMTAYEMSQRVQEYIRSILPLFEPMEMDYNGALCDMTFETLLRENAFGSSYDIPEELSGADVQFRFVSPLHDTIEQQKVQKLQMARGIVAESMALDQSVGALLDVRVATEDALDGIGIPAKWIRDSEQVEASMQKDREMEQVQQQIAMMQQGGAAAEQIGKAGAALQGMQQ